MTAIATGTGQLAAHQLVRQLKTSVAPHPFKDNSWRWGTVVQVHLPFPAEQTTATLAHAANAGDRHILVNMPALRSTPPVTKGAFVQVSSSLGSEIYPIASVAGQSGTYRLVLGRVSNNGTRAVVVSTPQPAGALVQVLPTVDVQMNGAVGAGTGSTKNVHYGVRYLASYSPQIGDQVVVAHMQRSDWCVVGPLATPASYLRSQPVATTGPAGYAMGIPTDLILQWTAPNDGQLHSAHVTCAYISSSNVSGGDLRWRVLYPSGTPQGWSDVSIASSQSLAPVTFNDWPLQPGQTVQLIQQTSVTAGTATVYASIYADL